MPSPRVIAQQLRDAWNGRGRQRAAQQRLAEEQIALRRVAELVANGATQGDVFGVVTVEACRLLGVDFTGLVRYEGDDPATIVALHAAPAGLQVGGRIPVGEDGVISQVHRTGRTARFENYRGAAGTGPAHAGRLGVTAGAGAPIHVEGRLWGVLMAMASGRPLPRGTDERLAQFAEFVALAVSGAQARAELRGLADEQAALRRVAELVARGVAQPELFASVADEASRLIADEATTLLRFDDGIATVVAICGGPAPVGARFAIAADDDSTPAIILRTGRPARLDRYDTADLPAYARAFQIGSSVGAPIIVEERVWGMLGTTTTGRTLPVMAEQRLQQFAELVAAALANVQARADLQRLADEQAGLRRVAELVARGAEPERVFAAVAAEAGRLLEGEAMTLTRFEGDRELLVVAVSGGPAAVGARIAFEADTLPDWVKQTGRPARVDDYTVERDARLAETFGLAASAASPISVEGRVWGMLVGTSPDRALPPGTEHRLQQFADLVAAAVANAESRAQLTASRARVVATADETRRRLQRDVHDGAQQRLVQTVLVLKLAQEALAGAPGTAAAMVDEALQHAERATSDLRDLVRGILPAALSRGGLRAGVESLVADAPLPVEVRVSAPRLAPEVETTAYFVVAEALANVVKHAGAGQAGVDVWLEGERLHLTVSDDGAGGADASRGSGLTGLYDRVEAGEGTLRIASPPGAGTVVAATLPLRARA